MLTRIYIDNFRCFVNFEYRPAQKQLILGPNGSGKSSLMDALRFLRRFVVLGHTLEQRRILTERTLWMNQPNQTFELEVSLDSGTYIYRLVIDSYGDPPRARVLSENVMFERKPIFEFEGGKVQLFDDRFRQTVGYPFSPRRSALAMLDETKDSRNLSQFKRWFANLLGFRINPFRMEFRAETEDPYPYSDLSNFASWYRHVIQTYPKENAALLDSLQAVLENFSILRLEHAGENVRLLIPEFTHDNQPGIRLAFNRLSDGQRCLIGLYSILHFVLAKGHTVILDEPDNFLALREIQPWLNAVSDLIDEQHGQVFIISHHPELMNQWAPDFGVQFIRKGIGPVRVKEFSGKAYNMLRPSEIVARGWENE